MIFGRKDRLGPFGSPKLVFAGLDLSDLCLDMESPTCTHMQMPSLMLTSLDMDIP